MGYGRPGAWEHLSRSPGSDTGVKKILRKGSIQARAKNGHALVRSRRRWVWGCGKQGKEVADQGTWMPEKHTHCNDLKTKVGITVFTPESFCMAKGI